MDSILYVQLKHDIQKRIKDLDARRILLNAAINSFGQQLAASLNLEDDYVGVGEISGGVFYPNKFLNGENGSVEFYVQLKFVFQNEVTASPHTKLRIEVLPEQKIFKLTALDSHNFATVPVLPSGGIVFHNAFHLIESGIKASLIDFFERY